MLNYSRTHRSVVEWGSREVSIGTPHSIYHPIYQAFATYLVRCEVDFGVLSSHLVSTMQRYKKERAFTHFPRYLTVFRGKTGKKSGVTGKKTGKKQENKTKKQKTSTYQKCCLQYIYIALIWPLESKTGKDITVDVAFIVSLSDGELSRVTIFRASVKL